MSDTTPGMPGVPYKADCYQQCPGTFYLFNQHKVTRVTNLSEYLPTLYLFNNTWIRVKHDPKISSYWKCLGKKMFQLRKDTREALVASLKERWIR